jgi:hypothetical protein
LQSIFAKPAPVAAFKGVGPSNAEFFPKRERYKPASCGCEADIFVEDFNNARPMEKGASK